MSTVQNEAYKQEEMGRMDGVSNAIIPRPRYHYSGRRFPAARFANAQDIARNI